MPKTLIIKTDAAGDVVRTTSILHVIDGEVFWLTSALNLPLFPTCLDRLRIASINDIPGFFFEPVYDLVINLEENKSIAQLAASFHAKKFSGVYLDGGELQYTADSSEWYDMSLISRYGPAKANDLKKANHSSYQHILFRMLGKSFNGEGYLIYEPNVDRRAGTKIIGLETHVGKRWPNKAWFGFTQLQERLSKDGFQTKLLERRGEVRDYLADIRLCDYLVTGDTLAMHIALAYRIPCIGIFNCTSPYEIFDYGILRKLVSPLLNTYYYQTSFNPEVMEAVRVEEVYETLKGSISADFQLNGKKC